MIDSIGSAVATPAIQPTRTDTAQEKATVDTTQTQEVAQEAPAATMSDESAAATRLGNQLGADADAARIQRAVGESTATTSSDTDYIAEADTNSDKTVSDEERAAYEAKLREQAEAQSVNTDQTDAVRAAYGQTLDPAATLDTSA